MRAVTKAPRRDEPSVRVDYGEEMETGIAHHRVAMLIASIAEPLTLAIALLAAWLGLVPQLQAERERSAVDRRVRNADAVQRRAGGRVVGNGALRRRVAAPISASTWVGVRGMSLRAEFGNP